jgi:hypothetical protein
MKFILSIILCIYLPALLLSQNRCEVLVPNLVGQYEGECKKGLASGEGVAIGIDKYDGKFKKGLPHGEGVYKWSTGEIYEGEWNKGLREGTGIYYVPINKDSLSILQGVWENDEYIGKEELKPKVLYRQLVDHYNFERVGDGNTLKFTVYKTGSINWNLLYLWVTPSSGKTRYSGGSFIIEGANFPLNCKVQYWSWNDMASRTDKSKFQFTIPEPGDWKVEVHNN